jgi:hypothetical protein
MTSQRHAGGKVTSRVKSEDTECFLGKPRGLTLGMAANCRSRYPWLEADALLEVKYYLNMCSKSP